MDYVVHMAAVIPPKSDNYPQQSYDCNREGAISLVNAIKKQNPQPKLIHISTIAVYFNASRPILPLTPVIAIFIVPPLQNF